MRRSSAFLEFVDAQDAKLEREFKKKADNRQELIGVAGKLWTDMGDEERQQWKERAQLKRPMDMARRVEQRQRMIHTNNGNSTTTNMMSGGGGIRRKPAQKPQLLLRGDDASISFYFSADEMATFSSQRRRQRKNLQSKLQWQITVDATGNSDKKDEGFEQIKSQRFFLLTAVPFVELQNHVCMPAEMCLAEFSLKDGVASQKWWMFPFDANELPPELQRQCKMRASGCDMREQAALGLSSKVGHLIPTVTHAAKPKLPTHDKGHRGLVENTAVAATSLSRRIRQSSWPLFVPASQYNDVQGCLTWLKQSRQQQSHGRELKSLSGENVMCLEDLVGTLITVTGNKSPTTTKELNSSLDLGHLRQRINYDGLLCEYHRSLSIKCRCAVADNKMLFWGVMTELERFFGTKAPVMPSVSRHRLSTIAESAVTNEGDASAQTEAATELQGAVMKTDSANYKANKAADRPRLGNKEGGTNGQDIDMSRYIHPVNPLTVMMKFMPHLLCDQSDVTYSDIGGDFLAAVHVDE